MAAKITTKLHHERHQRYLQIVNTFHLPSRVISQLLNLKGSRAANWRHGMTFFTRNDEYVLLHKINEHFADVSVKIANEIKDFAL